MIDGLSGFNHAIRIYYVYRINKEKAGTNTPKNLVYLSKF